MKTIAVYESATGFTEQYAKWIAEALACECAPLKKTSAAQLGSYDRVIFGGWIMANSIMGLDKLRGMTQPCAVFAVGSTPAYEEVVSAIKKQNKLESTPLFYMVGGFRFEQLGFMKKTILKTIKKSTMKKQNRSRQEDFMAEKLGTSFDNSGKEQIAALVEYCK